MLISGVQKGRRTLDTFTVNASVVEKDHRKIVGFIHAFNREYGARYGQCMRPDRSAKCAPRVGC